MAGRYNSRAVAAILTIAVLLGLTPALPAFHTSGDQIRPAANAHFSLQPLAASLQKLSPKQLIHSKRTGSSIDPALHASLCDPVLIVVHRDLAITQEPALPQSTISVVETRAPPQSSSS